MNALDIALRPITQVFYFYNTYQFGTELEENMNKKLVGLYFQKASFTLLHAHVISTMFGSHTFHL